MKNIKPINILHKYNNPRLQLLKNSENKLNDKLLSFFCRDKGKFKKDFTFLNNNKSSFTRNNITINNSINNIINNITINNYNNKKNNNNSLSKFRNFDLTTFMNSNTHGIDPKYNIKNSRNIKNLFLDNSNHSLFYQSFNTKGFKKPSSNTKQRENNLLNYKLQLFLNIPAYRKTKNYSKKSINSISKGSFNNQSLLVNLYQNENKTKLNEGNEKTSGKLKLANLYNSLDKNKNLFPSKNKSLSNYSNKNNLIENRNNKVKVDNYNYKKIPNYIIENERKVISVINNYVLNQENKNHLNQEKNSSFSETIKFSECSSKTEQEGELGLDEVKDIIIYYDFTNDIMNKKFYLFKKNDYSDFSKNRKKKYLDFFLK